VEISPNFYQFSKDNFLRASVKIIPMHITLYNMLKEGKSSKEIDHTIKTLFPNLLQGKAREKLKKEWKEKRQGALISYGSKSSTDKGNRLLRFVDINEELYLRITVGKSDFVFAKVYFPHTVELKLREGELYGFVNFEYPEPEVKITMDKRVKL